MSITLAGYNLNQTIHEGVNTVIYRAKREVDGTSAIVKALKAEYPTLQEITRLRHEHKILEGLDIEGIVRALGLESHQNSVALVLEDFGGESLKEFLSQNRPSLSEILKIACQIANALAELHDNQVIHKDIKPHNILINPHTGQVKLIDFSIASRLERENQSVSNPNLLEGTLAYMSPEQTGRMNRSLDYRTDFYSLGVTFYQMLTGQLPFNATDPLEFVHCHIAKKPVPPHALNPEIPEAVSEIVMKLLAKTAEDRYQSARGLLADLEICLKMLDTGKISHFAAGELDLYSQFLIPQKLYGREKEVVTLLDAFARVANGATEMMLVSGYSGIGKSALVHEVHKPIVRQRGYFISGKFDQFKRNIPYASVIQAFQELMRQILTENDERIAMWKSKLLKALGPNGKVIADVIPEVEKIIGSPPAIAQLGPSESQNRFNRVFRDFTHVFCQKEHPLVVFLDDLQWADLPSLKLLQMLVTDPDSQYLLLIGAYRDNEVSATHPLIHSLEEIQQAGATVNNIVLLPLDIEHVAELVADTLRSDSAKVKALAELVYQKTQGNPFFLTQLLKSLYQENLIAFDFNRETWQWDIDRLASIAITDNVVELMVSQIQKLSPQTQDVLKLAACVGDKFTLDVLAIVSEKSQSETAKDLWEALQAGLVLPLSQSYKIPLAMEGETAAEPEGDRLQITYKFLHDRVQQASYSLIPDEQKKQTHLKIGELLLAHATETEIEENLFEIVNQLNVGAELISQPSQKSELAKLNLTAGQKAKAATAYESAVKYLSVGMRLLGEDSWESQYDLTLGLYLEATAAEYLNINFERAKALAEEILTRAKTRLDRAKVYELQMQFYMAQNQTQEAIKTALRGLELLGIPLCEEPPQGMTLEDWENLPEMTDPEKLAAQRLSMTVAPAACTTDLAAFKKFVFTMLALCSQYGNSGVAAFAYAVYGGALLCRTPETINTAYEFQKLSLKLLEKFNAKELKAKIYTFANGHVRFWKEHARETIAPLLEGSQSGQETGDIEWAGYCAMYYGDHLLFTGEPLEVVARKQNQQFDFLVKVKQVFSVYFANPRRRLVLKLLGKAEEKYSLLGELVSDEEVWLRLLADGNHMLLFSAYLAEAMFLYFSKDAAGAARNAALAEKHKDGVPSLMIVSQQNFYYSLALLAHCGELSSSDRALALEQVAKNQAMMQQWAELAPCNFAHKYELIEAERYRVLGQALDAMDAYDRAIIGAKQYGYVHEEALANELAAEFYFWRGKEKIAQTYLNECYYSYGLWGATLKLKDLEKNYSQLLRLSLREPVAIEANQATTTTGKSASLLDFASVMKASQALSGEIVLANLLKKLMKIAIENAGAQTGFLILEKNGELLIEARGAADKEDVAVLQGIPVSDTQELPLSALNYVARAREDLVLNNASREGLFTADPYIAERQPKSILCTAIAHQGKLTGILYLENNLTEGAFTPDRLEVLKLLSSQAAISIENARLYSDLAAANATLEAKVQERTQQLQEKNEHLQKAEEAAKAASHAKSEFLANMSHELRTPLNGILGYAQILKRDKNLNEVQRDGLNVISHCGDHLLTLINDILDLSKIEARKMEIHPSSFHFPEFLEGIAEICYIRAEQKGIFLIYEPLTELPVGVRGDEKRLRQVLLNLLGNAIKFTEKGGVTLKVGYQEGKIRFQVEDTGVGMAPEQLGEIFLPFHQVGENSRKIEGTGLGLAIGRQLVQMMGGEIQVKSTLGVGSTFFFDLDLPEVSEWANKTAQTHAESILGFKGDRRKIIVADDKWENRTILAAMLQPLGFEVVEATDGQDCLSKALTFQPDCILMDLMMPVMSGLEATRRLRKLPELRDITVIAVSASVFDFDRRKSIEEGCNDFLPKPIRADDLLEKLRVHLGLEWICDSETAERSLEPDTQRKSATGEMVAPPPEELEALFDLAMMGDLRGIAERTAQLEQVDEQWLPFASHLRQLAKEFEERKILDFVKHYMGSEK